MSQAFHWRNSLLHVLIENYRTSGPKAYQFSDRNVRNIKSFSHLTNWSHSNYVCSVSHWLYYLCITCLHQKQTKHNQLVPSASFWLNLSSLWALRGQCVQSTSLHEIRPCYISYQILHQSDINPCYTLFFYQPRFDFYPHPIQVQTHGKLPLNGTRTARN